MDAERERNGEIMSTLSARFTQSPAEVKRYVMDYTLQLAPGENIDSIAVNIVPTAGPATAIGAPPLQVTGAALLPPVKGQTIGAAFFVSGGVDQGQYEVQFLATTSLTQILEDVVQYTLAEKL